MTNTPTDPQADDIPMTSIWYHPETDRMGLWAIDHTSKAVGIMAVDEKEGPDPKAMVIDFAYRSGILSVLAAAPLNEGWEYVDRF